MVQIITLTLSPAIDVHCDCPGFAPYHESIAHVTSRDAGGKGINISGALTKNGIQNLAIVALGSESAADFEAQLKAHGIPYAPLYRSGRIRENITVHTPQKPETRISFSGFSADVALLCEVEALLDRLTSGTKETIVTFTGRVPNGIPMADVKAFLLRLRERGIRLVIDSKSFSYEDLLELRPWLIKPNEEEILEYAAKDTSEQTLLSAATEFRRFGIENAMISLGARGALLACAEGVLLANAPSIEPVSTIGAGDSSIAGFLAAYAEGLDASACLARAVAYGSAACLTAGTTPPSPEEIGSLLSKIHVKKKP